MVNQACACGCGRSLAGRPPKTRFFEAKCRRKAFDRRRAGVLAVVPTAERVHLLPTVREALEAAGRDQTYLGLAALAVAERLDGSDGIQGLAPVVKELRETMDRALAGSQQSGKLREMRHGGLRNSKAVDEAAS